MFMIGVDEVGRGCLAGPLLVVAARASAELPLGLKDSKLLTSQKRQEFYKELIKICDYGEGWVSATEINSHGLAKALKLGVQRALDNLGADAEEDILLDGIVNYVPPKYKKSHCEAKADNNYPVVSAASIIAKVKRDECMRQLSIQHPGYGFESHVGYGTVVHLKAIEELGILEGVHRTIFANFQKAAI